MKMGWMTRVCWSCFSFWLRDWLADLLPSVLEESWALALVAA